MGNSTPVVLAKGISKSFSGVFVLKHVDFDILPGEVHALVGENGAGKSTLMKIISGVYQPTEGQLLLDGEPARFKDPHQAREAGIALIHQEPLTFQDLNVVENLYLGHTRTNGKPIINWRELHRKTDELLDALNVRIRSRDPVRGMSIADQQVVEIACALSQNARVIIMDEPTAALSHGEVKTLFKTISRLKEQGKAIIFIGHRLEEIMQIADRVTILRDGERVSECMAGDFTQEDIVRMMVGRSFKELMVKDNIPGNDLALETVNLTYPGRYFNVSLKLHRGEIVGMSGLVGAGRSEFASAVFGVAPADSGDILVRGEKVRIRNPVDAMRNGIAMVSEDRSRTGLLTSFSIRFNMTFAILRRVATRAGFIRRKAEMPLVRQYTDHLSVRMRDAEQAVKELSGGNQQKVFIAKWLLTESDILILDEPTRGIDIGAKMDIYRLISDLAGQGKAILMISSELPEILQLSDRVYVMCEGHVTAEFTRQEMTGEKIMAAASTLQREGAG